jgi:hypothetical protein
MNKKKPWQVRPYEPKKLPKKIDKLPKMLHPKKSSYEA